MPAGYHPARHHPEGVDHPLVGEFHRDFGLTRERLRHLKPDAIIMHPGPINRGVEIDSAVADGKQSVILPQVTFGIAVRMAVMSMCMSGRETERDDSLTPERPHATTR